MHFYHNLNLFINDGTLQQKQVNIIVNILIIVIRKNNAFFVVGMSKCNLCKKNRKKKGRKGITLRYLTCKVERTLHQLQRKPLPQGSSATSPYQTALIWTQQALWNIKCCPGEFSLYVHLVLKPDIFS